MILVRGLWDDGWPIQALVAIDTLLAPDADYPAPGRISLAAVGEDGKLAFVDALGQEVWARTTPEGSWILAAQQGDGPGEIGFAAGLWWEGSTLAVYDARRSRILRLEDAQTVLGSGVVLPKISETATRASVFGSADEILVSISGYVGPETDLGVHRPDRTVVRIPTSKTNADPADTIGIWPGRAWARTASAMAQGYGPIPFGPDTFIRATDTTVAVADSEEPQVQLIPLGHSDTIIVRWTDRPERSGRRVAEFKRERLQEVPDAQRGLARDMLESMPMPDSLPYLGNVLLGDGETWLAGWYPSEIEGGEQPPPATDWRVVRHGSVPEVEQATFPAGMLPLAVVSQDEVLLLLEDELGRQGLGLARLRRNHASQE